MSRHLAIFFCINMLSTSAMALTYQAQPIRTEAVDFLRGERRQTESLECIPLPSGYFAFEQSTFVTRIVHSHDESEKSCTMRFDDYIEIIPGIKEPRTACLHSFVKSVGGAVVSGNKRGHLTCAVHYGVLQAVQSGTIEERKHSTGFPEGKDTRTSIVTIPADLSLQRERYSLVTFSVPLDAIQFGIDKAIRESKTDLPAGFKVTVKKSRWDSYAPGTTTLHYYVALDVSGPIGVHCEINAKLAIPAARLEKLIVQDVGTTANCGTGNSIGQFGDLPQKLSNAIKDRITKFLGKPLLEANDTSAEFEGNDTLDKWWKKWSEEDPALAKFLSMARVQGSYCNWRGKRGLCLNIGWLARDAIARWEADLLANVTKAAGPIDLPSAKVKLKEFYDEAVAKHMVTRNGVTYPSGRWPNGEVEDGDIALIGGLICRSGLERGCRLIRDVRTQDDGRFWRSPRRVREADTSKHATFSGDQLKGILHFFTIEKDQAVLGEFLHYLNNQLTNIPDKSLPLESGFSSCPNRYPNFTCVLSGGDWFTLVILAKQLGVESKLPKNVDEMIKRYGFSYETLVWEALLTMNGFRLHLTANTAWTLRTLGDNDPHLRKVIALAAARHPENPFFLYLLHGADRSVQTAADSKCKIAGRNDFSDWAWRRAESEKAWERSMVWDCAFIYSLLVQDPKP